MNPQTTAKDFDQRSRAYLAEATKQARQWYDNDGNWIARSRRAERRERFWLCFALYANGEAVLADAIIRRGGTELSVATYFIFDPNIACELLVQHRDKMAEDVRQIMEFFVERSFEFCPGNRQPDYQFHGYNDNMPAMATAGLVLGGELLGNAEAVEYGLWNLRQFRSQLTRRGINSEFNSPTYTPVTVHSMGEIAHFAQSAEARDLARGIEARLWIDIAARFHPQTGTVAGPFARTYTTDTLAHLSSLAALLWFHLGDQAHPSPMELFAPPPDLVLHHCGDIPFNIAQMCEFAAGKYHIPQLAWEMFAHKDYPFQARASYEVGDYGPPVPAHSSSTETWMQPDYTVSTADTTSCGAQTEAYFVTYRRQEKVQSFRDIGTVYSKMVLNNDVPGTQKTPDGASVEDDKSDYHGEEDLLSSPANMMTLQSRETVLAVSHFNFALAEKRPIERLSEMVLFPAHHGGADEVIVGGASRASWDGEATHGDWIAMRRGRLLIGIRPLVYTQSLPPVKISLETINQYEVIRSTFYQGEKRTFTQAELSGIFGGFVAEHASVEEFDSLEEFASMLAGAKFTDYYWRTRRARYRRPKSTFREALDMEVSWSPGSYAPRYAIVNGEEKNSPILQIDGVDNSEVPFLNEPFQSIPGFFPWQDFKNFWCDWPYAIGDREEE